MRSLVVVFALAGVCAGSIGRAAAAEGSAETVWVRLKDGSQLVGRIVSEDEAQFELRTEGGLSVHVPRASVESIGKSPHERTYDDPHDSRLLFAPTGRPLRKGDGYFSDHYVFLPGVAYGLTDNVTLMGGMSIVPGAGISDQLIYLAPKLGARVSDTFAVSGGYLYTKVGSQGLEDGAGIGFAVATFGGAERSVTAGFGYAHSQDAGSPIVMVGGQARLSRRLFFITENWLILHEDFQLDNQPFSAALRFCGDRLSVDFGVVVVGEVLEEGFPLPWVSFSYHFGPSHKARASASAAVPRLRRSTPRSDLVRRRP